MRRIVVNRGTCFTRSTFRSWELPGRVKKLTWDTFRCGPRSDNICCCLCYSPVSQRTFFLHKHTVHSNVSTFQSDALYATSWSTTHGLSAMHIARHSSSYKNSRSWPFSRSRPGRVQLTSPVSMSRARCGADLGCWHIPLWLLFIKIKDCL